MGLGSDHELGKAVADYQQAADDDQRISSLKQIASQVKHKALAESTAISIIGLVIEAISFRGEVRDAAFALLAYLVRRMHSQGQLSSSAVSAALNGIPNWPDTLIDLRKRGVPAEIRTQLQQALERPPSSGRMTPGGSNGRALSRPGVGRTAVPRPGSALSNAGRETLSASVNTVVDNGLEPLYIASASQLDQLSRDMLPDFEGKESEHNWPRRDKNITKLRQITKGNAPADFQAAYLASWKLLFEGIMKCATSLRTTFSTNGSQCIQEAAVALGHNLDVYAGRLFEMALKMCSDTKPIAAQNGSNTIMSLIGNVSWSKHILQYISEATKDKNVRPREFSYYWLKTALEVHGHRKSVLEQGHGLDMLEKCFKTGIADPNPKVRETAKKIFWDFHRVFPTRGDALLSSLDDRVQKSINAISPSGGVAAEPTQAPRAAPAKTNALGSRPSIKDIMAAKRREKAMERPQSALANMQPSESKLDTKKSVPSRPAAVRQAQETTGGLSSAPVRPGRKVVARQPSRGEGLANGDSDRPKTPFRSSAVQRPQSRAEAKKDVPRRPGTAKAAIPIRPASAFVKPTSTNSLPASPEKALELTPSHRRPKSIAEDSPSSGRIPRLVDSARIASSPRISTPASQRRLSRDSSPLHSHTSPSRIATPARVYEDPRSSPSLSPVDRGSRAFPSSERSLTRSIDRSRSAMNLTPKLSAPADSTISFNDDFSPVKMPLMELSNNEVNTPQLSMKNDPRSDKLIDSGIVHMKNGKLDPHGYRKLHDAVLQNIDGLPENKFEELLSGVLAIRASGYENVSDGNPIISSDRILVQRLHLLSALAKSPLVEPYLASILRTLIHILRYDARQESHTYWVAEGMLKEFAMISTRFPNEVCRGVLEQPQDYLNAVVLKAIALLVQNRAFDRGDSDLVATLSELAGQAIANHKDVDARIQGHQLAQALGPDTIKEFLGEDKAGVAFMLYQNMKAAN